MGVEIEEGELWREAADWMEDGMWSNVGVPTWKIYYFDDEISIIL